jgi:hypothetical protein
MFQQQIPEPSGKKFLSPDPSELVAKPIGSKANNTTPYIILKPGLHSRNELYSCLCKNTIRKAEKYEKEPSTF